MYELEVNNKIVKFKFQYDNTLRSFSMFSENSTDKFKFQYDNTLST